MKASSCIFLALSGLALSALATPTVLTATDGDTLAQDIERLKVALGPRDQSGANTAVPDDDTWGPNIGVLTAPYCMVWTCYLGLHNTCLCALLAGNSHDAVGANIYLLKGKTKNTTGFNEGCEDSKTSGFDSLNVKWLEQAGARVIPIRYETHQRYSVPHAK